MNRTAKRDLPPIAFEHVPLTPLPDVIDARDDVSIALAWLRWDEATSQLDAKLAT